jgi:hypothetical protein
MVADASKEPLGCVQLKYGPILVLTLIADAYSKLQSTQGYLRVPIYMPDGTQMKAGRLALLGKFHSVDLIV